MKRVIVVGGTGFFGAAAAELLRARGVAPVVASRRGPGLHLDAESPASLRETLRAGDVVLDAAGPFQGRTAALVEAAAGIGCDVVDISDSLDHVLAVEALRPRIASAGIRVLTSCSSVTTLAAALVRAGGCVDPARVSVFLAPASADTARAGTSAALAHSLGRSIRVYRDGRLTRAVGWRESRRFAMPSPIGACRGYLMESVQAATFPALWPGLRTTEFWVDSRVRGMNALFSLAARLPPLRLGLDRARRRGGTAVARLLGSTAGGMRVDAEDRSGRVTTATVHAARRSYLAAVIPAVLATHELAAGRGPDPGLVPHDRHNDSEALFGLLEASNIRLRTGVVPGAGVATRIFATNAEPPPPAKDDVG